jgi:hypothetical protein
MASKADLENASSRARELLFQAQQVLVAVHSKTDDDLAAKSAAVFLEIIGSKLQGSVATIAGVQESVELSNIDSPIVSIAGVSGATAHEVAGKLASAVYHTARNAFMSEGFARFSHRFPDDQHAGGNGWTHLIPDSIQVFPATEVNSDSIIATFRAATAVSGYWKPVRAALSRIPLFDWQPWEAHIRKESQRAVVRLGQGNDVAETHPRKAKLDGLPDEAMMNHADLAQYLSLESEALRKRLDRGRVQNKEGWQEVDEPASREPKYMYRIGAVRSVLESAVASSESSG